MPFIMNKIVIHKTGESTGTASVKLVDDSELSLILNKIQIDMNSGDDPVAILKHEGTQIFSGDIPDLIKDVVFEVFQDSLAEEKPGIYEIRKNVVKKIK